MNREERAVGHHYDDNIFEYELERLERHSPVEFGLTIRALTRWVPTAAEVAVEVGVGSGAYSSWLASRGINVHLVDVSEKLLETSSDGLERQGLGGRSRVAITSRRRTSATYEMEMPTFSWPLVPSITSENSMIDADRSVKRREC